MHDAQLHSRFRIDRLDGFREAFEPVDTGDKDILHAPRLQFSHHLRGCPEFCVNGVSINSLKSVQKETENRGSAVPLQVKGYPLKLDALLS